MTFLQRIKPYLVGAFGMAVTAMIVSPDVRSAAAALVTVTNTFSNPVPTRQADNPALQPFGTRVFPTVRQFASFAVPADKSLVITSVSGFNNGNGSLSDIEVDVTSSGIGSAQRYPFSHPGGSTAQWYLPTAATFLVADPGTTVYISADDSDLNDSAGVNVDIHGYYVNAH